MSQTRSYTIIMERVFPLPPDKDGEKPDISQMNEIHKILRDVEIVQYPEELNCLLIQYVEGLGIRGDIVRVKRTLFHEQLFPSGMAVYASPDNIKELEDERKALGIDKPEARLGVQARMAIKELSHMNLEIPMNDKEEWTLTKEHVQVAFRIQGVELQEECIVLPEEEVKEFKELIVKVCINGLESVDVKANIIPISQKYVIPKK
ncbi:39S ribosomal protein L9 mitochondrial [Biomphalaria pfeifferi]|uniref:Large ribosomal subunit protein bL9m n=1 Tax=Biomphalaria pfeifferi TaxID=112525 RepID=A0AAD8C907_BIOPF|nr:39S ribosomal protein L9 mitochondrial [Biomphalaria pfeifferi]